MSDGLALASAMTTPDTGVLVLQMGGPRDLSEVRPFIRRMLSDPAVVALPAALRLPLAVLVSVLRARNVRRQYRVIGGGSPIADISQVQAARVGEALIRAGRPMPVLLGMRYSRPYIPDAVATAVGMGLKTLVALPLYPQYSETTTGSALAETRRAIARVRADVRLVEVRDYADHPPYVAALTATVAEALSRLTLPGRRAARVLFSAHGLPERYVRAGDPYPGRIADTVRAVAAALGGRLPPHAVCYQSRLGPVRWIGPSTRDALREAAAGGARAVVMVPVAFVSDHLETLHEMDIVYRDLAASLGIAEFVRANALNDSRQLGEALADVVLRHVD